MEPSTVAVTEVTCHAPHPAGLNGVSRYAGQRHGATIGAVNGSAVPTGRVLANLTDLAPGCIGWRCMSRDCNDPTTGFRNITEYRLGSE